MYQKGDRVALVNPFLLPEYDGLEGTFSHYQADYGTALFNPGVVILDNDPDPEAAKLHGGFEVFEHELRKIV